MTQFKTTASFALTAAALALASSAFAADTPKIASGKAVGAADKVHCYNVNECKGQGDCKTSANSCKGQAACKGQGFKATSAKDCLGKNGVIADL
ncbi:MAG: hypothetical protein ABI919_00320 [Ramlibacter sp.]